MQNSKSLRIWPRSYGRDYAAVMRNSEYMENEYREQLQRRVKADMNSPPVGLDVR